MSGAIRFHGYKAIGCDTPHAVDLLKSVVDMCEGAKLSVVRLGEIPSRTKLYMLIPVKKVGESQLLTFLSAQKPELTTAKCKVLRIGSEYLLLFGLMTKELVVRINKLASQRRVGRRRKGRCKNHQLDGRAAES